MLARTKVLARGVKRSRLTVLGVVAVEVSAGGRTAYQILYVTKETKKLILSGSCLEPLGCCPRTSTPWVYGGSATDIRGGESHSRGKGSIWMFRQV